jgi:Mitochondrial ATP synthase epsilon chain
MSSIAQLTLVRYNRYLAVAARVVRRSLKDDKRLVAESRGNMDLRFAKWQVRSLTRSDGLDG